MLLNTYDEGQKSTSAMLLLCDAIEAFLQSISKVGRGEFLDVYWSLLSSKDLAEGSRAGCALPDTLAPVPKLSFEVMHRAAGV